MSSPDRWRAEDFQRVLLLVVALFTLAAISPFAVVRYIHGEYWVAAADAFIVVVSVLAGGYSWVTKRTEVPGSVIVVLDTVGLLIVATMIGVEGAIWVFPLIIFAFYISPPWLALLVSVAAVGGLSVEHAFVSGGIFAGSQQLVSFVVSATAAIVFSYFFSVRSNRQRDMLTQLATKDPLTNLYNRRTLEDGLEGALAERDRHGRRYGLVILDLDHFKELNDRLGHAAGDRFLVRFAEMLTGTIRKSDRAFRYGGDEFVVLLPDTDEIGLRRVAESIIEGVWNRIRDGEQLGVSAGAAILRLDDDKESWNRRADRCLYTAKDSGRNTVVLDSELDPQSG